MIKEKKNLLSLKVKVPSVAYLMFVRLAFNKKETLSFPELSDHLHLAVVDQAGKIKTYNYGLN